MTGDPTAPPQWSPDGQWWWDGAQWVPSASVPHGSGVAVSEPEAAGREATFPAEQPEPLSEHRGLAVSESEKAGFFKKTKHFVQEKQAEGKAKREAAAEAERTWHEAAERKYGRLVANETFGRRRIELYEGGYVRVLGLLNVTGGLKLKDEQIAAVEQLGAGDLLQRAFDAFDAPFEKLRAIKASTQIQDKSAGGRAVASAASFGLSKLASNENRILFLTISTDRETYSLHETGGMSRLQDQIAMKLELAGQGILDALGSRAPSAPSTPAPGSVADQLRDLAALHRDGVLTEEEFAAAKAKLLGS